MSTFNDGQPVSSSADALYCDRAYVESIYGADNIKVWADLDNDQDPTKIDVRIGDAIEDSSRYFDDRMRNHLVVLPLAQPYPRTVQRIVGLLSGYRLYEARGIQDQNDKLETHIKEAKKTIDKILADIIDLGVDRMLSHPGTATYP